MDHRAEARAGGELLARVAGKQQLADTVEDLANLLEGRELVAHADLQRTVLCVDANELVEELLAKAGGSSTMKS